MKDNELKLHIKETISNLIEKYSNGILDTNFHNELFLYKEQDGYMRVERISILGICWGYKRIGGKNV